MTRCPRMIIWRLPRPRAKIISRPSGPTFAARGNVAHAAGVTAPDPDGVLRLTGWGTPSCKGRSLSGGMRPGGAGIGAGSVIL